MAGLSELVERLKSPDARVRRVAVMDLVRAGEPGHAALLEHLPGETDDKAAVQIIRALADSSLPGAQQVLARLRDDPKTPVRIYHAAVLAHDRLERRRGRA